MTLFTNVKMIIIALSISFIVGACSGGGGGGTTTTTATVTGLSTAENTQLLNE